MDLKDRWAADRITIRTVKNNTGQKKKEPPQKNRLLLNKRAAAERAAAERAAATVWQLSDRECRLVEAMSVGG